MAETATTLASSPSKELVMLRGMVFGLIIAVPIGPNAVLCIDRAVRQGLRGGVLTGLGTASAHAAYAALALHGIVAHAIPGVRTVAGLVLVVIGTRLLFRRSAPQVPVGRHGLVLSGLAFALANPMTLISFGALFAGLRTTPARVTQRSRLVVGIFLGSALWWIVLTSLVTLIGLEVDGMWQRRLHRLSGLALVNYGVWRVLAR